MSADGSNVVTLAPTKPLAETAADIKKRAYATLGELCVIFDECAAAGLTMQMGIAPNQHGKASVTFLEIKQVF
jgi:hypothetical protein